MADSSRATIDQLAALGQETRFRIFRHLMTAGREEVPVGALGELLDILPSTLSTHLGILARVNLVRARRDGRTLYYSADIDGVRAMFEALVKDCCNGHPELCAALDAADLFTCGR